MDFNLNKIFYGEKEVEASAQALIETENGLIVGTIDYQEVIEEFFSKPQNCFRNKTRMEYETFNYFYCLKDLDETKMENLTFLFKYKKKRY